MKAVMVLGDFMLDRYEFGVVRRISPEAPVPILEVQREEARPGGAGSVAADLAALGLMPVCAGVVGDDPEGAALVAALIEARCDVEHVVTDPGRPTTVKTRLIARSQQLLRKDREVISRAQDGRLRQAIDEEVPHCAAVVVSDYGKGVVSDDLAAAVLDAAQAVGIPSIVDPARDADYRRYRGATVICPNEAQARSAARGCVELNDVGEFLGTLLPGTAVLITRDARGVTLCENAQRTLDVPAVVHQVYDVTGAGDMVVAALAWALIEGRKLHDAVRIANVAGGLEVQRMGATPIPLAELRQHIEGG